MFRKLIVAAALAASAAAVAAAADGVGVEAWAGASAGDVLSAPGAAATLGVVVGGQLFGQDVEGGVDELAWGIGPESSIGLDAYWATNFALGESPLSLSVGSAYSFAFEESLLVDGGIYAELGLAAGGVDVAAAKIDLGYLEANELALGLSLTLGAGYALDFGAAGSLSAWASIGADLLGGFALGDPELELDYSLPIGESYALSAVAISALSLAEGASLSLEPSLVFTARF